MALNIIDEALEGRHQTRHHLYAITVGTTNEDPGAKQKSGSPLSKGIPIFKDAFFVHEKHPSIKVQLGTKVSHRRALAPDFPAWNGRMLAAVRSDGPTARAEPWKYLETPPPLWMPADGYRLEPLGKKSFKALIHYPRFEDAAEMRRVAMTPDKAYEELYSSTGGKPPGWAPPVNGAPFCSSWDVKTADRWNPKAGEFQKMPCAGDSCPFAISGDCKYQTGIEYTLNEPGFPKVGCFTHTGSFYGALDLRDFQLKAEKMWEVELRQRSIPNPPPMNWANASVIFSVFTRHRKSVKRNRWEEYPVIELALDGTMGDLIDAQLAKAEDTQNRIRNLIAGSALPGLQLQETPRIRGLLEEDTSILIPQPEIIRPRPAALAPPSSSSPSTSEAPPIDLEPGTPTDPTTGRPTCQACTTTMRPVRSRTDDTTRWKCETCGSYRRWNGTIEV